MIYSYTVLINKLFTTPQKSKPESVLGPVISAREWVWLFIISSLLFFFSSLPYLVGYQVETSDWVYSGAAFDRQDYAVHMATMHLGYQGEWKYQFRFTSEAQNGAFIKLGYLFLGNVARWFRLSLLETYHLARAFFGFFTCSMIYGFAAYSFKSITWRRIALLVSIMGAGLGWLQLLYNWAPISDISPIEFWLIDPFVFLGWMTMPHFIAVTGFMVMVMLVSISYFHQPRWWKWPLAAASIIIVQVIQPYAPLLIDLSVLGIFLLDAWRNKRLMLRKEAFLVLLALVQFPLLFYSVSVFNSSITWQKFAAQNVTLSPPPLYYLWGFGLLWPLALMGLVMAGRRLVSESSSRLNDVLPLSFGAVIIWSFIAPVLAYLPTNLQRRFMHGYSLPLAFLGVYGLHSIPPYLKPRLMVFIRQHRITLGIILIFFLSLSTFIMCAGNAVLIAGKPPSLFDPGELVQAVDWLGEKAREDDLVLSSEQTGQLIAARIGNPVLLGHPIETLDYDKKSNLVKNYFTNKLDENQVSALRVDWVVDGPFESVYSDKFLPYDNLRVFYQHHQVTIYRTNP